MALERNQQKSKFFFIDSISEDRWSNWLKTKVKIN